MTKQEYVLICMMEECNEVSHACAKALRFGLENVDSRFTEEVTNKDMIKLEYTQVIGIVRLMRKYGLMTKTINLEEVQQKINKIERYMRGMENECKMGKTTSS